MLGGRKDWNAEEKHSQQEKKIAETPAKNWENGRFEIQYQAANTDFHLECLTPPLSINPSNASQMEAVSFLPL